jgi:hypothetical protein
MQNLLTKSYRVKTARPYTEVEAAYWNRVQVEREAAIRKESNAAYCGVCGRLAKRVKGVALCYRCESGY